ncbi:uncharacterized protein KY384_006837 [Bacidia gigantensis]|uniref:uncharacterized protein n=1 Tax=Bacidia gigantensis TaxID=2732470 RepID=UPI001D0593FC|nr:uncharacterized protein KY384_006837 [Bacidia gigantensis]KAG8527921.1 hypothetical protein KY384_006837 [Bacidia gigantensis]
MQLLAAPTREEVDKAHAKATWLDIGVPSFRNLRQISRSNCTMWSVLALSSLPIHFLYNSTVFSSLTGNGVAFVTAHESFLEGPSWTNETATPFIPVIHGHGPPNTTTNTFEIISAIHNDYRNNTSLYENHTTYECLSAYMNPFSWRPRLLIMISSNESVLNNSATYIDWGIQTSAPDAVAHLLCDGETAMSKKCAALDTLTSDTIGWWIIGTGLRTQRVYNRSISVTSLWAMGFGETKVEEIVSWNQANEGRLGLFVNILIANIWQVVIALAYTAHNALLSCMLVADEWVGFATDRKGNSPGSCLAQRISQDVSPESTMHPQFADTEW